MNMHKLNIGIFHKIIFVNDISRLPMETYDTDMGIVLCHAGKYRHRILPVCSPYSRLYVRYLFLHCNALTCTQEGMVIIMI